MKPGNYIWYYVRPMQGWRVGCLISLGRKWARVRPIPPFSRAPGRSRRVPVTDIKEDWNTGGVGGRLLNGR